MRNPDVLRIIKEDILRVLAEKGKRIPLSLLKAKIKVFPPFLTKALEELKRERMIKTEGSFIELTKEGQKRAEIILRRHLLLEDYFKKTLNEKVAHRRAHILEHYVSEEVIRNLKKLFTFKKKGISLIDFKKKEGFITDINLNIKLFERLVSMGICPGRKIRIINRVPDGLIIRVKNKKFVLDKIIAKGVKVLRYGKT